MNDLAVKKLVEGYREFLNHYRGDEYASYRSWAGSMQVPRVMIIACSDSRANPAILTQAELGDLFLVNNVANLVPPYKEGHDTHHSTSAALEFAINHLKVEHVIVLGHSGCGGIKALMQGTARTTPEGGVYSFIGPWMEIAAPAKQKVVQQYPDSTLEVQAMHCEKESLLVSLSNLRSFPWVKSALAEGRLGIHAWHFDILTGDILHYCNKQQKFIPLLEAFAVPAA